MAHKTETQCTMREVPTELQTPEGSLSYGMNAVLAGYERDRLKERLWQGRKAKIEKGEYWVTPEVTTNE